MSNHQLSQKDTKLNTIADVIKHSCENYPEDIAFSWNINKTDVSSITYGELKKVVYSISNYLSDNGFSSSHIGVIGDNSIEWIEVYLGVTVGGGVIVPLDKELSAVDIEKLVIRARCEVVFYSKAYKKKIASLEESDDTIKFICFSKFEKIVENYKDALCEPSHKPQPDNLASIVYTSGTTGESKGVMLSQKNLVSDAVAGLDTIINFRKTLNILPLHHTFGLITNVLEPMIIHAEVFICKNMRKISRDIEAHNPDVLILVPVIVELLYKKLIEAIKESGESERFSKGVKLSNFLLKLKIDRREKIFSDIHKKLGGNLKTIICGGAPISKELQQCFEELGIEIYNGYGITECAPIIAVSPQGKNRLGSVGKPLNCNEVRINHKNSDGIGSIEVKGSNIMLGYFDDKEQTEEAFDGEWFRTGDIGKFDKDGYLIITGREKNLIILSNGKNVSPEEIEDKLIKSNLIKEVIVYADGEKLTAEVYTGESVTEEIKEQVNAVIDEYNRTAPNYKGIQHVVVRDSEFPKTTTMKIKRK